MAMLREGRKNWSEKDTEKSCLMIKNARRIYVAGFGISRSVVEFITFRFNRLGYRLSPHIGGAEIVEKLFSANSSDIIITIGCFRPPGNQHYLHDSGEKGLHNCPDRFFRITPCNEQMLFCTQEEAPERLTHRWSPRWLLQT
jgi:GDP-D-mannose dehydratase